MNRVLLHRPGRCALALIPVLGLAIGLASCEIGGGDGQAPSSSSTDTATTTNPSPGPSSSSSPLGSGSLSWHAASQVGPSSADFGGLAYAPNGSLFVAYTNSESDLDVQVRAAGGSSFGSSVTVNNPDCETMAFHFADSQHLWLACENYGTAFIYFSSDSGQTWTGQSAYSATDDAGAVADNQLAFASNGTDTTLFFGYSVQTPTGVVHDTYSATYSNGSWAGSATDLMNGPQCQIGGAIQNSSGDTLLASDGIYLSTNGAGFTRQQDSAGGDQDINSLSQMGLAQQASSGALFLSDTYFNSELDLWSSSNFGSTWTQLHAFPVSSILLSTQIAVSSNVVVAVVLVQDANNQPAQIVGTISYDSGLTWSALNTIVDETGTSNSISSMSLAAYNGVFSLVYSLEDSGGLGNTGSAEGVYLTELY